MVHLGDITKVDGGKIPPVHVITFGSPCQNLSLIGNRSGLAGAKSSLFYQAFRIIQEMRDATDNLYPAIAVWENVMGAFSTNDRMDFRAVLSAFSDTEVPMPPSGRWGNAGMVRGGTPDVCWRLMDAQYWAGSRRLARRQRIFVVADFGGRRAADILFKPRPMLPLPPPCGEGGWAAAEGDRTASFETGRQIPVIHPFQCFRMRGAAKRQEETAFRNSFGLPTDPFPTLLASDVTPFAFWYEGDPEGGCIRFLTETESERLMGLPEGWTKYGADGVEIRPLQRYKALGNAIALPCADYIMAGIKRILTAPIKMPDNTTVLPNKGTPQGGIISPLLANIVLNELDWWIASQWEENPIAISRGRERIIGKTKVFDKSHGYRIMKNTEMKEMHIIRYADDFRIFCRTKEDAVRTKEAATAWIEERLKLEVSPEKTRIVNTRKRWSEFLGFKIRVRLKHHKYVVQSAICDKKVEIERAKLVEQAKNIAKPREKKSCLSEIQLYNSMVLGIQNYYQLATCISIDCRELHRRVMTVLTNRLNTETGSMLKHEGGTITQAEKERFGQSKMIRYVSGIDQMIYPIAFIKNKIPMAKRSIVCSYTKEGRAPIHTELNLNQYVLKGLREKISVGHSTEYHDSKISLFSAQKGKCAISGEEFADAEHVAVWLKVPRALGGFERYKNMVLIHKKYLILLQELPQAVIKDLIKTLNITKKMLVKINSLREQANLSAII